MIRSPVVMRSVASGTPTTAGIPYSRATTAPCDIIPPISITSALAVRKSGVHPGSVDGATNTSPGSRTAPAGERITRAIPRAVPRAAAGGDRGRQDPARSVHARQDVRERRLRLVGPASELRVRRDRGVIEPLVVGDRAEEMGWVFGPPRQPDVDLGDGPMPVPAEE